MPIFAAPWAAFAATGALGVVLSAGIQAAGPIIKCHEHHTCAEIGSTGDALLYNKTHMLTEVGPCGVPQYNYDLCQQELRKVRIETSLPATGVAQFDNVPPTCMVLATVLNGACSSGSTVHPCGTACLYYSGLTGNELDILSQALQAYVK